MRRPAAGAAALLCAGLTLSGALHHLLVEHAQCVEHGELTHAHDDHDDAHAGRARAESATPIAARTDDHGRGEHEHCQMANAPRGDLWAAPAAAAPVASAPEQADAKTRTAAHGGAVLSCAPKTSPPA